MFRLATFAIFFNNFTYYMLQWSRTENLGHIHSITWFRNARLEAFNSRYSEWWRHVALWKDVEKLRTLVQNWISPQENSYQNIRTTTNWH